MYPLPITYGYLSVLSPLTQVGALDTNLDYLCCTASKSQLEHPALSKYGKL